MSSGTSGETVYSAAKAGVVALAKSLAREWARFGIRVNVVAPGVTQTPLLESQGGEALLASVVRAIPMRRAGSPDEIAAAIEFMSSERGQLRHGPDAVRRRRADDELVSHRSREGTVNQRPEQTRWETHEHAGQDSDHHRWLPRDGAAAGREARAPRRPTWSSTIAGTTRRPRTRSLRSRRWAASALAVQADVADTDSVESLVAAVASSASAASTSSSPTPRRAPSSRSRRSTGGTSRRP